MAPSSGKTVYCFFIAVSIIKKGTIISLCIRKDPKEIFEYNLLRLFEKVPELFSGKVLDINVCVSSKSNLDQSLLWLEYIIVINVGIFQSKVLRLSLFTGHQHGNVVHFRVKAGIDFSVILLTFLRHHKESSIKWEQN